MKPFVALVVGAFCAGGFVAGCLVYVDRCAGVVCGAGEVCIDIARGATCVCDDFHETTDDGCVPLDDGDDSAGTSG